MYPDPTLTLADQMRMIADLFLRILGPEARKLRIGATSLAIWRRVQLLTGRFCALYAMWKAGTLPKARVRAVAAPPPPPQPSPASAGEGACGAGEGEGELGAVGPPPPQPSPASAGEGARRAGEGLGAVDAARVRPASLLPRTLRWLQAMAPMSAGTLGGGVDSLVRNYPEMQDFVRDCPQVGRVLRPLLRMAGLGVPEYLALPKRKRVRARKDCAVDHPSPRPSPPRGEGEVRRRRRTPREVAAAAIARSLRTGKPVDPRKIGAVAFAYVLHWPRDGNCPPPEIGYGGRMFPLRPKG